MKSLSVLILSSYFALFELIISPRNKICSFLIKLVSIEMSLFSMIHSPSESFLKQIARKMGLMREALVFMSCTSLSKAFLIFSMMFAYSLMISKASVNSLEKNLDSTSKEFSFWMSSR